MRTATGDRIAGSYHCRWNKWKDAQLSRRKDVECDRKDGLGEIEEKRIRRFYLLNISGGGISKIVSLQKADLYIDIICITQNKIVKNRKKNNI